ncbi:hypothetical protein ACFFRR_005028 [Megaselia abdita]
MIIPCGKTIGYCLVFIYLEFAYGLKDVSVRVPKAVKRGDNAMLVCNYDMENDTLYSVKWYKGRREFYRYTPKENPAMKIFNHAGINVERSESNQSNVLLTDVQNGIAGKYSCEVSADAPTFNTAIDSGEMEVVEIPDQRPVITGIHSRYKFGDVISGNCSSDNSYPAANLSWFINEMPVFHNYVRVLDVQKHDELNLKSATTEINFIVKHIHFIRGRLKLKCTATIYNIYRQEAEKVIEEDRPRLLASGPDNDFISNDDDGGHDYYLNHLGDGVFFLKKVIFPIKSSFFFL